jgi:hypothetical protein
MAQSNKKNKLIKQTVNFDDKWEIKPTVISNNKNKSL